MLRNQNKPQFSIITCTLNSERFLEKNLSSVRIQKFKNIEHIIIDGKSTDSTLEIVARYKSKVDYPVKVVAREPKGVSNAFNEGIKIASGKDVCFLNSDDLFYDEKVLVDVHKYMETKNIDWIYGKIQVVNEKYEVIGVFPENRLLQAASPFLLKFINFVPHQSVFIKRRVFEDYGLFDENLETSMDRDLWLRLAQHTKWDFFNRIVSTYMIRPDSVSSPARSENKNLEYVEKAQSKHLNFVELFIAKLFNRILSIINKLK